MKPNPYSAEKRRKEIEKKKKKEEKRLKKSQVKDAGDNEEIMDEDADGDESAR